jgi:hypothetical protein
MLQQTKESAAGASWMEHQILQHVKDALRVTIDWQAPAVSLPRKISSVRFTLKSFNRHIERLMALEEEGGYLSAVTEEKPHLQERVDKLAGDHGRLRSGIRRIVPMLDELQEWQEADFERACDEIRKLLHDVDMHDLAEIDLLQELCFDEGGEG